MRRPTVNKTHTTLRLGTNLALVAVWAFSTVVLASLSDPPPVAEIAAGGFLGAVGGCLQWLSFNEGKAGFLQATTALEVRRRLKETKWGKRYIYFLWMAAGGLAALSLAVSESPQFAFPAAYFGMMLVREMVTLKPTLALHRMLGAAR